MEKAPGRIFEHHLLGKPIISDDERKELLKLHEDVEVLLHWVGVTTGMTDEQQAILKILLKVRKIIRDTMSLYDLKVISDPLPSDQLITKPDGSIDLSGARDVEGGRIFKWR